MKLEILVAVIGFGALIAVGTYSNWQTALAIFIAMLMNNLEVK